MTSLGPGFTDWDSLRYARGKADFPAILADLRSSDPEQALAALELLSFIMIEIGPLYPETPDAVPLLAAEVNDPDSPLPRRDLLYVLLLVASAKDDHALMERVYAELGAAVPRLLPLLSDPDDTVREFTVQLLAWARPEDPAPVLAALREWFDADASAMAREGAAVSFASALRRECPEAHPEVVRMVTGALSDSPEAHGFLRVWNDERVNGSDTSEENG